MGYLCCWTRCLISCFGLFLLYASYCYRHIDLANLSREDLLVTALSNRRIGTAMSIFLAKYQPFPLLTPPHLPRRQTSHLVEPKRSSYYSKIPKKPYTMNKPSIWHCSASKTTTQITFLFPNFIRLLFSSRYPTSIHLWSIPTVPLLLHTYPS